MRGDLQEVRVIEDEGLGETATLAGRGALATSKEANLTEVLVGMQLIDVCVRLAMKDEHSALRNKKHLLAVFLALFDNEVAHLERYVLEQKSYLANESQLKVLKDICSLKQLPVQVHLFKEGMAGERKG